MPSDLVYGLTGLVFVILLFVISFILVRRIRRKVNAPDQPETIEPIVEKKHWPFSKVSRCDYCGCANKPDKLKCEFCGAPL
jgi:hypothetical protein